MLPYEVYDKLHHSRPLRNKNLLRYNQLAFVKMSLAKQQAAARRRLSERKFTLKTNIRLHPYGYQPSPSPFTEVDPGHWKGAGGPRKLRQPILDSEDPRRLKGKAPTTTDLSPWLKLHPNIPMTPGEQGVSFWPPQATNPSGWKWSNTSGSPSAYLQTIASIVHRIEEKDEPVHTKDFFKNKPLPQDIGMMEHHRNVLSDFYENIPMDTEIDRRLSTAINKANNILYPYTAEQQHLRQYTDPQVEAMYKGHIAARSQEPPTLSLQHLMGAARSGNLPVDIAQAQIINDLNVQEAAGLAQNARRAAFDVNDPTRQPPRFYFPRSQGGTDPDLW